MIAMKRASVNEDLIINHIHAHGMAAPLQTNDLINLPQQGVSSRVIAAMQESPPRVQQPVVVQQAPPPVIVEEYPALLRPARLRWPALPPPLVNADLLCGHKRLVATGRRTRAGAAAGRRVPANGTAAALSVSRQRDGASDVGPILVSGRRSVRFRAISGRWQRCLGRAGASGCGDSSQRRSPGLPPFQGGAAGLFSYDLGRSLERVPPPKADEFGVPALAVGFYDVVVAFDHAAGRAWIISQGFPEIEPRAAQRRAAERLARFAAGLPSG